MKAEPSVAATLSSPIDTECRALRSLDLTGGPVSVYVIRIYHLDAFSLTFDMAYVRKDGLNAGLNVDGG